MNFLLATGKVHLPLYLYLYLCTLAVGAVLQQKVRSSTEHNYRAEKCHFRQK